MKTLAVVLLVSAVAAVQARADGFDCLASSSKTSLEVKVYNHRDPAHGTKKAAVMVLADPSLPKGKRTIARFTDTEGDLSNAAAHFTATVGDADHEGPADVSVDTVTLNGVSTIDVDVNFTYSGPSDDGRKFSGYLTLNKTDGTVDVVDLECKRYLAQ